ncbi:MAG: ABC transporter permease [Bacteriovoracia bacterium]
MWLARSLTFLLAILLVFFLSRTLVRWLPGDPLETLMAETGTSWDPDLLKKEFHLDRPWSESLWLDLKRAARGDFGRSLLSREAVGPLVQRRLANTLVLAGTALALTLVFSLSLALLSQSESFPFRRQADWLCSTYGGLSAALPLPWLGPMITYLLAVKFPIFDLGESVALPALSIALVMAGFWARFIRARIRESLRTPYAMNARARGLPELNVLLKYGLFPVSGALVGFLGTQAGQLLTGSVVAEIIFDRPGMGSLLVESVLKRDYPIVEAAAFAGGVFCLLGNWLGTFAQTRVLRRAAGEEAA